MKKTDITFLNLAAQSPTLELNFALSEKIHRTNKSNHIFFMCGQGKSGKVRESQGIQN